jgi:hypothetical protein
MSVEIELGWNDNHHHHADERLNMTRNSERGKKNEEKDTLFLFLLVFENNKCIRSFSNQ